MSDDSLTLDAPCPGAGRPVARTWRDSTSGERLGTCPHCARIVNVTPEGLVYAGHEWTVTAPVHEQIEAVRWSLFPPGHPDRFPWSVAAHLTQDGWWYLRDPANYLTRDREWRFGDPILSMAAHLTFNEARVLAFERLPHVRVGRLTATQALAKFGEPA
jgi:hypothetical protein